MGKIFISETMSLDGGVQDPAGDEGFGRGIFRFPSPGSRSVMVGNRRERLRWAVNSDLCIVTCARPASSARERVCSSCAKR